MIRPTLHGRIVSLDVLRGFAILGILLANIGVFATVNMGQMSGQYLPVTDGVSSLLNAGVVALVAGKFRSLLSILFGVGLYLQFRKRSQVTHSWPGGYFKRALLLALFGAVHAIVIWLGDILLMYALLSFVAALLVCVSERKLAWTIGILGGLSALIALLMLAVSTSPAAAKLAQGNDLKLLSPDTLLATYANGTFIDTLSHRWQAFQFFIPQTIIFSAFMLPLFLLGVLFGRSGILAAPSKFPKARTTALLTGFGIGLPLNLLAVGFRVEEHPMSALAWEMLFGPLLSVGYLMLGAIAVEQGWLKPLQRALENVGRTALSCYILQSVLCTTFFYGWGMGWYGRLEAAQLLGVVAAVWLVNIVFATLWLRSFAMGPLEWLWRSLTEGKRLPILRSRIPVPVEPPATQPALPDEQRDVVFQV